MANEPSAAQPLLARRVALAIGAAGLATAAGCASYGGNTDRPAPGTPPAEDRGEDGGAGGRGGDTELGATGDIPVGGGKIFADNEVVVTQPSQGTFAAFSAVCTHQGCVVDAVADGTINCSCHGSKFKIADGSVAVGPVTQQLARKSVTASAGKITLG